MVDRRVAVAATGAASADAGMAAAAAGGNAVDAAIAAMVTAMTTEPAIVSVLGGAFVSVWPASGDPGCLRSPGSGPRPVRPGGLGRCPGAQHRRGARRVPRRRGGRRLPVVH